MKNMGQKYKKHSRKFTATEKRGLSTIRFLLRSGIPVNVSFKIVPSEEQEERPAKVDSPAKVDPTPVIVESRGLKCRECGAPTIGKAVICPLCNKERLKGLRDAERYGA